MILTTRFSRVFGVVPDFESGVRPFLESLQEELKQQ